MTACYTFYSYKGGSGRTTTLLNTAKHLIDELGSNPQKPLLLVDADLESAGLTYFFNAQDKFTDLFPKSIHTCKIINSGEYLSRNESVFGALSGDERNLNAVIKALSPHFKQVDIQAIFGDLELPLTEQKILQKIADECSRYMENTACVEGQDLEIVDKYISALGRLLSALDKIEKSELSLEEKLSSKRKAITDFLPAYSFMDVSRFFGKEEGTVKFLGVDVSYSGEQLVANTSVFAIMQLVGECEKREYGAILFDSGAGVQSSANALHKTSDVIVCCMRPSQQFINGTRLQLVTYEAQLAEKKEYKSDDNKKMVIILPTAVPEESEQTKELQKASFAEISKIAKDFAHVTDGYFCKVEKSVHEVGLFKWREQILGVKDAHELSDEVRRISDLYADVKTMPEDASKAYGIYLELAKRLIENT